MACDFADLVQNGFCTRPVAPLQGLVWVPFVHVARCVSAKYPSAKQLLTVLHSRQDLRKKLRERG